MAALEDDQYNEGKAGAGLGRIRLVRAGRNDRAVGLDGDAAGSRIAAKIGQHSTARAKAGIQAAIRVIPGQGKFLAAGRRSKPGDHDLAVALDGYALGYAIQVRSKAGADLLFVPYSSSVNSPSAS